MTIRQIVRIEYIKLGIITKNLAKEKLRLNSRQLMYHHLDKKNEKIVSKVEEDLNSIRFIACDIGSLEIFSLSLL